MQIPEFTLPSFVGKLGRILPAMPPELVLVFTLNRMLKKGVLPADMSLLAGKHYQIDVLDAGLTIRFTATEEKFTLSRSAQTPDLRFAANTADSIKILLREEDPDTLFFNRRLMIEGDTELGLVVKNLFDSVDWSSTPLSYIMNH
jgi:predicted lipid carrier protein YhbT